MAQLDVFYEKGELCSLEIFNFENIYKYIKFLPIDAILCSRNSDDKSKCIHLVKVYLCAAQHDCQSPVFQWYV